MQFLRLFCTTLFFFSFCSKTFGVAPSLDSLEKILSRTNDPHEQILVLENAYDYYDRRNNKKSKLIAERALKIALDYSKKDLPRTYNLVGYYFLNSGKSDSAMVYFQEALDYCLLRGDSVYLAKTYNNIGVIQFNSDNYDEGIENFTRSANIEMEIGQYRDASLSFNNIGGIYIALDDYKNARVYLEKALVLAKKVDDPHVLAHTYINFGSLEKVDGNIMIAKKYYFNAIDIYKENRDWQGVSDTYGNLSVLYEDLKNPAMALEYNNLSLKYLMRLDNPNPADLSNAYYNAAQSYEQQGDYKRSVGFYKLYIAWNDTVVRQENRKLLLEAQEKYNSDRTEKENQLLATKNELTAVELEKQQTALSKSRVIIYSAVIGLVLLVAFLLVLYNRNYIRKKANDALSRANDVISETNKHVSDSIKYASNIQKALLPGIDNSHLFKDSFIILEPKDVVSGDFFWYGNVGNKKIIAAIDCTGHGVPGAFMSMIGNTYLNQIVNEKNISKPSEILEALRKNVVKALNQRNEEKWRDGMDVAICTIDEEDKTIEFAGANNPLYARLKGEIIEVKGDRQPVGYVSEYSKPFQNHSFTFEEGDVAFIFSDGYPDQFGGPKGKKYRYGRFKELLFKNADLPMTRQKEILLQEFEDWKGELEQIDDVCVIGFRL